MKKVSNFIPRCEVSLFQRAVSTRRIEQREFEDLVKQASKGQSDNSTPRGPMKETFLNEGVHPDAPRRPKPEFEGDVNPVTGERGGPKIEPVKHNDWSNSGRVTDF
ncbi:uncharacterized protein EI90DRAFT_3073283 [Cantharellus anzutake]|uniref:uncharacterized protein n=1 Tax=Cantharellus anzutake TaxID=1750568 RepID=UPI0019066DE5|nr:uncharacterized protein EI90DRAFT_3073283 [Cantharellus anzutake]KAF8325192.1 hypothetical protein EI90DRAFT_3073283 [Cantharellus anzutake]